MTTITIPSALLEQALAALESCTTGGYVDIDGDFQKTYRYSKSLVDDALKAIRAELAKPVEPSYTYASTQATTCACCGKHKHTPLRIDAMGGYVCLTCIDQKLGSLLGEFGYPEPDLTPAWHDAPNELGRWTTAAGKATDIRVDGAVMLDREMREWTQARQMYLYWSIAGWHVMIGRHFCTLSCNSPEDAILDAWNSGEYDDLEKCAAIAKAEGGAG